MSVPSIGHRFKPRNRTAWALGCCLLMALTLGHGWAEDDAAGADDEVLRELLARDGSVQVQVDLRLPGDPAAPRDDAAQALWQEDLDQAAQDLLFALPAGSYDSVLREPGSSTLTARVDAAGLDNLLVSPLAAAVAAAGNPEMRRIAAGSSHALAVKADGSLWVWGRNASCQLGDGSSIDRLSPIQVLTGLPNQGLGGGVYHSLAVKADGSLWAWGYNNSSQIGDGVYGCHYNPVQVMTGVAAAAAGYYHSVALKTDGTVWAWGGNSGGQIGDGTTTERATPVQVLSGVADVAAGRSYTMALKNDGSLWAWGTIAFSGLGDGTTSPHTSPVQVQTGVAGMAGGGLHGLFRKADGSLWAWGNNDYGQLGDGTGTQRLSPVQVLTGVVAMAAGANHSLAIKSDGTLWAWGRNASGQLGDGSYTNRLRPVQIMSGVAAVAAGEGFSLARKTDGTLWAWGDNVAGQLGNGTTTIRVSPFQISAFSPWPDFAVTDVLVTPGVPASDGTFTAAITVKNQGTVAGTPGTLQVWADQPAVQDCAALGDQSATLASLAPGASATLTFSGLPAGAAGTKSLRAFVDSRCQTGETDESNNQTTKPFAVTTVALPTPDFALTDLVPNPFSPRGNTTFDVKVTVTNRGTAAGAPGTLQVWANQPGLPVCGAVGEQAATVPSLAPGASTTVTLSGLAAGAPGAKTLRAFVDSACATVEDNETDNQSIKGYVVGNPHQRIAGGKYHSVAINPDGSLWAWGANIWGQLGDGTTQSRLSPVQVLTGVAAVDAGWGHTLAIKTDGSLWAWGDNGKGQLGDNMASTRLSPIQVLTEVTTASAGGMHTLAIKADGSVWSWGYNMEGALGDGTTITRSTPAKVLTGATAVDAGGYHSLALDAEGGLWAWGANWAGQIGDGTYTNRLNPVRVLTGVTAMAAGERHSLALKSDGSLWAWGNNTNGQLGDGTTTTRLSPVQVMTGVTAVAGGLYYSLAVKSDGSLWAWGLNAEGELGDGTTTNRLSPVQVMTGVATVVAGASSDHSLVVKTDGSLWGFGYNGSGELGTGTTGNRVLPIRASLFPPRPDFVVTGVGLTPSGPTAGGTFSAAITVKNQGTAAGVPGTLQVWADQSAIQDCAAVGDKLATLGSLAVGASTTVTLSGFSAGALGAKTLRAFIDSACQTLEIDDGNNQTVKTYSVLPPVPDFAVTGLVVSPSSPSAGGTFEARVTVTNRGSAAGGPGTVQIWADQSAVRTCGALGGQSVSLESLAAGAATTVTFRGLAAGAPGVKTLRAFVDSACLTAEFDETDNQATTSYRVAENPEMERIAAGHSHSLAIKPDGSLWAWGYNAYGQVGDASITNRPIPVSVLSAVRAVAATWGRSQALKTDGSLWAWGYNTSGEIGDGSTTNRSRPVQVLSGVAAMAAGYYHTLAVKTDGSLWTWGWNVGGQLGDGTTTDHRSPVRLLTLTGVASVAAGSLYSLALKTDGSLWAWGDNTYGSIGDGTVTSRSSPVQVLTGVGAVATYSNHSLALKNDGSVWAWGYNGSGELGDGTTTNRRSPIQVLTGVVAVAAGNGHSLAVKTDGSLWAWGNNAYGQLGDGTTTNRRYPVQVLTGVAAVAGGSGHTLVRKTDGSLWAWGYNASGQLGDGTTTQCATPIQIQYLSSVATTALVASLNPSRSGQTVNFTATVTPPGATGSVTFMDGETTLGSAPLVAGSATYATATLTVGTHAITAVYGGDGIYGASTSPILSQTVSGLTSVTLVTVPAGLHVTVDGAGYATPQTFDWSPGSTHTIAAASPQGGSGGSRSVFSSWSDGGARSHVILVPDTATTYIASFGSEYQLTTLTGTGGTVQPGSGGWFAAGTTPVIIATAAAGYVFNAWDLTTGGGWITNPASAATTVMIDGPTTVTANVLAVSTTLKAVVTSKGGTLGGVRTWTIELRNSAASPVAAARLTGLGLSASGACRPTVTSALPLELGDIPVGGARSGTLSVNFAGCTKLAKFNGSIAFSADGGATAGVTRVQGVNQ